MHHGCRCDICKRAVADYERNRQAGVELTVPSDVPAMVVRQLHDDAHLTYARIASACGGTRNGIANIASGTTRHTRKQIADALYALQAEVELAHPKLAAKWSLDAELAER